MLSGAIVTLLDRHGRLRVYCYSAHEPSVRSFFAAYPGIEIVPVLPGRGCYGVPEESLLLPFVDGPVLRSGFYAAQGIRSDISFPELFYAQLGIPYRERWDSCPLEEAATAISQLETDIPIFVHDDAARGYHIVKAITAKPVFRPWEDGGSILRYVAILRAASEIHCIDSSFYHVVESLIGITAKLYYHRYARLYIYGWFDYPRRYAWQVLP